MRATPWLAVVVGLVASAPSGAATGKMYAFTSTKQGVAHGGK